MMDEFTDGESVYGTNRTIELPEYSEWRCELFGMGDYAITFRPIKGQHPNWFWRKMQYLCFGNKWVKDNER
jgi:hypothetical protein